MAAKIGNVQAVSSGGTIGKGFVIHDDRGSPILTLAYATEQQAKDARAIVQQALSNTVFVAGPP